MENQIRIHQNIRAQHQTMPGRYAELCRSLEVVTTNFSVSLRANVADIASGHHAGPRAEAANYHVPNDGRHAAWPFCNVRRDLFIASPPYIRRPFVRGAILDGTSSMQRPRRLAARALHHLPELLCSWHHLT
jgi:hypothetical protein